MKNVYLFAGLNKDALEKRNYIYESYLYLSKQEIVFIPAPKEFDPEKISLWSGYRALFSPNYISRYSLTYEMAKKICQYPEVVKMLGRLYWEFIKDPDEVISVDYSRDSFRLSNYYKSERQSIYHKFNVEEKSLISRLFNADPISYESFQRDHKEDENIANDQPKLGLRL